MSGAKYVKSFWIILVVDIVLVAAWLFLFSFIQNMRSSYVESAGTLMAENNKEDYVAHTSKELRETESQRGKLAQIFVAKGGESIFLEKIETLAGTAKVDLSVITFDEEANNLLLKVKTSGDFEDVYYFLSLVSAMPLEVSVDSGTLTRFRTPAGGELWEGIFSIRLKSYASGLK